MSISVVINTLDQEKDIKRVIESVKWADEMIICDMHSYDKTVEFAKKMGAKVFFHKRLDFVEPARNFAISKATSDWILVLDPDEEVSQTLSERLIQISSQMSEIDYVRLPRKNLIFGKWIKSSGWWPDYNVRFFKKGKVIWGDKIHRPPQTLGEGLDLSADEKWAIIHHHYESIPQFVERMIRYTKVQSKQLSKDGYEFAWQDLIKEPLSEFLRRFFVERGFEDGLHGLALALLQAFSQLIVYLRVWEKEGFKPQEVQLESLRQLNNNSAEQLNYWFKYGNLSRNPFKRFFQKVRNTI